MFTGKPFVTDAIHAEFDLIKAYLDILKVPYEEGFDRTNEGSPTIQLKFHFAARKLENGNTLIPDVVVGILHADDVLFNKEDIFKHPLFSIETYHFPWDGDSISVFATPIGFAKAVYRLYMGEKDLDWDDVQDWGDDEDE